MENSKSLVILVVFLLLVIVSGSNLPECEAETSCPDSSCERGKVDIQGLLVLNTIEFYSSLNDVHYHVKCSVYR